MKIDGKQIAQGILEDLKIKIEKEAKKPHLAIVSVGNDPASISYVKQKQLRAEEIGAKTTLIKLDSRIDENELVAVIEKLNNNNDINGIIVQKPLPEQIDNRVIDLRINPKKDIDAFNPESKFVFPIGLAILEVLKKIYKNLENLKNKKIVILGKGETGGKPIRETLERTGVDPIIIDSKTVSPKQIINTADIIISAVGKKNIIKSSMLKNGVALIGAGQHRENDGEFHGDYEEEEIKNITSFYTPTPGGIGPINVAMLLKNLFDATQSTC
jgi:methylenetetrahydrofolate dehydrogenase (NADP+) / methenyltetrahydrofolate cyclohydrolase